MSKLTNNQQRFMKQRISLPAFIFFVIVFSTYSAISQQKINPKKKSNLSVPNRTTVSRPAYDSKPFNANLESLPPQYLGNDIERIFDALYDRKDISGKGEYEATEQYRLRLNTERLSPIIGGLNVESIFAFRLEEVATKYDADNQLLNIFFVPAVIEEGVDKSVENYEKYGRTTNDNIRAVDIKSKESREKYIGSNAFGVRKEITRFFNEDYKLSITNWKKFIDRRYIEPKAEMPANIPIVFGLPMPPETAIANRNNLTVLLICKLVEPNFFAYGENHLPTIDSPTEQHAQYLYLNVKLLEYWIFDKFSGEIYFKVKEKAEEPIAKNEIIKPENGLIPIKIISRPKAEMTVAARNNNVEGKVVLSVTFLASGQIGEIKIISGLPDGLTEEGIKAAKQMKFEPAKKNGVPVDTTRIVEYNFINIK